MANKSVLTGTLLGSILLSSGVHAATLVKPTNLNEFDTVKSSSTVQNLNVVEIRDAIKSQYNMGQDYSLSVSTSFLDKVGNTHTRMQLEYQGMPVWGQQVASHTLRKSGKINLSGSLLVNIEADINTAVPPALSSSAVLSQAQSLLETKHGKLARIERNTQQLVVYFHEVTGKAVRAYEIDLFGFLEAGGPVRHKFIIDADSGQLLRTWNALNHAQVTGPGGNEKTGRYQFGTDYEALNGTDLGNGNCSLENENVKAVDLQHTFNDFWSDPFIFPCYENTHKDINGAYSPINDAFYFGNLAFDMYRDWYDTAPLPFQLSMKVHYGVDHENAYWTGDSMLFGDGFSLFHPLVDVNVSVHEVSHGFTEFNANLIYSDQSGGMNEAFSDIAGEAAEYYWKGEVDWIVGADIFKQEDAGLRYFATPSLDGVSIDHADDYIPGMDVHFSSGVYNRAYYLMSTLPNWDPQKAFDVFVLANQAYWLNDETFNTGACGLVQAASDLEYDWLSVYASLLAVGAECQSNNIDEDADGMSDIAEMVLGFDPSNPDDALLDFDKDGLSNRAELSTGTDPKDLDSDDDGLMDSEELTMLGTDPRVTDTDDDGIYDGWEFEYGLNPINDSDALLDLDADGISNLREFIDGTDPSDPDDFITQGIITTLIYDFENGDASDFELSEFGDAGFELYEGVAAEGIFSLGSADITHNQFAAVELNIESEAGVLTFDLKTSTEFGWDYFELYIDRSFVFSQSGDIDWQPLSFELTEGEHEIIFAYYKDGSVDSFEDKVWIDNVYYTGMATDTDGDGMTDNWELAFGFDVNVDDSALDADQDGLTNLEEFTAKTNPTLADTDEDGLSDGDELNTVLSSPVVFDTDGDWIGDGMEVSLSLDPLDATDGALDLDMDGFTNSIEAKYGSLLDDETSVPAAHSAIYLDFSDAELDDIWSLPALTESWHVREGQLVNDPISNDKAAVISVTDVFNEGSLYFDVMGSTELDADMFELWLDGTLLVEYSGDFSERVKVDIPQGESTLTWAYRKNLVASSLQDSVAVTNLIFFTPDADTDSDGLTDAEEYETYNTLVMNPDSDGDTLSDGDEVNTLGTDPLSEDTDGDNVNDNLDAFPTDATETEDLDGDGIGNNADTDDDGDGVDDTSDAFPLDASETVDTDGDGIGNNADIDDDGDGVADTRDYYPLDASRHEKPSGGSFNGAIIVLLLGMTALRRRRSVQQRS
ncbi:M4 family metallopeptidase [Alteromonas sp. KUL49]|uniref:M4 family metallopeptidase n=1 Tax=Alteromonas sp. KUL49 TaxID=2480798 RepID=UPI00102F1453|nr:M4 family metallopeptidase [Alteromonas sp. KUL49]TAP41543.1 peptidase M4 family protein [Alteromonas sp. KUL49]GEA10638.1 hypothetical protein KUL49_10130 [Alteromonas sp. KUL49]